MKLDKSSIWADYGSELLNVSGFDEDLNIHTVKTSGYTLKQATELLADYVSQKVCGCANCY